MFEFDLQLFDEKSEEPQSAPETETSEESAEPLPEELSGLPEEYAREVLAEHEHHQTEPEVEEESQPAFAEERKTPAPSTVPYDRFKEKVDEANRLKAQLAEYQKRQQPQPQPQQPQQQQQYQLPQFRITPEISEKITQAIDAEAMTMTGFTQDDVASLEYADGDDPRLAQWAQAKSIASAEVFNAIRENRRLQEQKKWQFISERDEATRDYNEFAKKAIAEPDYNEIVKFATNDFYNQLSPQDRRRIATAYSHVEEQSASPDEAWIVKTYYKLAKAAYYTRNAKSKPQVNQPPQLPRSDQLRGAVSTGDGQLNRREIEKLLEGDFTKIDEKTQKKLLGFT